MIRLNPLELDERIRDEVEENPALDADPPDYSDSVTAESPADDTPTPSDGEEKTELIDAFSPDDYSGDYLTAQDSNASELPPLGTNLTVQDDFRVKLHEQLALMELNPRDTLLTEYLVDSLEDDGYLRRSMEDICDDISFANNLFITEEELGLNLETIQGLEPIGVGARDLRECLLLQLEAKSAQTEGIQAACAIVENHLEDLANQKKAHICKTLAISEATFDCAVLLIKNLRPRPVGNMTPQVYKNQNIIPEFSIEKTEDGQLSATLLNSNRSGIRLNKTMVERLEHFKNQKNKDAESQSTEQYMKSKLDAALWFIEMIRQRENSMLSTIQAIVQLQYDYFITGDEKQLRPMILKDIADQVGLDISTISRVTSTKYALTHFGIVHLKSLFNQGMMTSSGDLVTNQEVQDQIAKIIEQEDKTNPLSDQEIAKLLHDKGYIMARRTVAKYRDALNIPPLKLRQI